MKNKFLIFFLSLIIIVLVIVLVIKETNYLDNSEIRNNSFIENFNFNDKNNISDDESNILDNDNLEGLMTFKHDGMDREYFIDLPEDYGNNEYPLVLGFHGSGGTYKKFLRDFKHLVDRNEFIGVYPQGFDKRWNSTILEETDYDNIDDVDYIDSLIKYLKLNYNIDESRVYVVGSSNGAGLAHRLALELEDTFAAFSSLAGSLESKVEFDDGYSISTLLIHGVDDTTVTYNGGTGILGINFMSAENALEFWANLNNCELGPVINNQQDAKFTRYNGCNDNVEIVLISLFDVGHGIPKSFINKKRPDIIWEFFKEKSI
ncbi:hypothetical protein HOE31_02025 [bacterium]|jgi:polyhydroxybutyrate depolymerase|nr:hypothetical protein [bacterium]MBT4121709.1 hypothetical protein [bacterium]MBT4335467.1 hypothetical protein [bacterium]MBT4764358.1 hypothetical protein [bacterium]MBT5401729.1 hypothetical protein [bacterium]